ncbi:hypothetical protein AC1031_019649 [Aphanomyces cochlioides]|nr:hypothetical protein AC1031_019649 [Aphanomyces cochlioides]
MANTRAFWYIQVNELHAVDTPTKLCLPDDCVVDAFKQAIAENSRNTHTPSTIVIYANQDAFQAKRPLLEKDILSDHGSSFEVPIIVEIQSPPFPYTPAAQWYNSIMECNELPPVSLLRDKVRSPLSTLIPISKEVMAAFTSEPELRLESINRVFEVDETKRCSSQLMDHIKNVLYYRIQTSATAASFHAFWDTIILGTLDYYYAGRGYSWDRPWHKGSSRYSYRPDFIFRLVDMCVLRGKERAPHVDLEVPRRQLLEHFEWLYDPAPYVFAYVACGYELELYAIAPRGTDNAEDCSRCHKKRKLSPCKMIYLDYFNLKSLSGRLNLFRSLVNISPIFGILSRCVPIQTIMNSLVLTTILSILTNMKALLLS